MAQNPSSALLPESLPKFWWMTRKSMKLVHTKFEKEKTQQSQPAAGEQPGLASSSKHAQKWAKIRTPCLGFS